MNGPGNTNLPQAPGDYSGQPASLGSQAKVLRIETITKMLFAFTTILLAGFGSYLFNAASKIDEIAVELSILRSQAATAEQVDLVSKRLDLFLGAITALHWSDPSAREIIVDLQGELTRINSLVDPNSSDSVSWPKIIEHSNQLVINASVSLPGAWRVSLDNVSTGSYFVVAPFDARVISIEEGVVPIPDNLGGMSYGRVTIEGGKNKLVVGRLSTVEVNVGDEIKAGDKIGTTTASSPVCITLTLFRKDSHFPMDIRPFLEEYFNTQDE